MTNPPELYGRYRMPLLMLSTGVMVLLSLLWYLPGADHGEGIGPYHVYAFSEYRFTNVMTMYVNHDLRTYSGPAYILNGPGIEYPALLSGFIRAASGIAEAGANLRAYMWLNGLVILPFALLLVWMIARWPGSKPWMFAASPILFLYALYNWDIIALCSCLGGLLLLRESTEHPDPGRRYNLWLEVAGFAVLVIGCWFKLFPVVFLGAAFIDRFRQRLWQPIGIGILLGIVLSAAINLPFILANFDSWWYFFKIHQERPAEPSLLYLLLGGMDVNAPGTIDTMNRVSALLVLAGGLCIAALALFTRRRDIMLPTAALLLIWWFTFNKIYDPNFDIWLLVLLAALAAPAWLYVGFTVTSLAWYFIAFEGLHYSKVKGAGAEDIVAWHVGHTLLFALILRLALLAVMLFWLARKLAEADVPVTEQQAVPRETYANEEKVWQTS